MRSRLVLPVVAMIALIVAFVTFSPPLHAQKQRGVNTWTEEHTGAPYVGVIVHYVLPQGFKNAGHPRAAVVTRAGYDNNAADLKVLLSAEDVGPGEPTQLDLKQVRADCCGDFDTWHWPPDPRNFKTSGQ